MVASDEKFQDHHWKKKKKKETKTMSTMCFYFVISKINKSTNGTSGDQTNLMFISKKVAVAQEEKVGHPTIRRSLARIPGSPGCMSKCP